MLKPIMRYYPVFLDIAEKPCVVIGGGSVAERKVTGLLSAGAAVTVISPRVAGGIKALEKKGALKLVKRGYKKGDLKGALLVVCASSSKTVNRAAYRHALDASLLVNVVDDPGRCTFIVPSVVDRGSLLVAISTSGKGPALSKKLRKDIEEEIGPEYAAFAELLGRVRNKLLKNGINSVKKERVIKAIVDSPLPVWFAAESTGKINGFLKDLLGDGYTLEKLGVRVKKKDAAGVRY